MPRWLLFLILGIVTILTVVIGSAYLLRHELTRMQEDLPGFTHGAGKSWEEMVTVEEGVRLYTTVALPDGDGPHPTVLVRNPYAAFGTILRDTLCGRFVRYGYGCVFQDVRGQGESEGEWSPLVNEAADGKATLTWLAKQDFQDGNLAMVGPSYLGAVQLAAATMGLPPEVKTLIPSVYTTDSRGVMYQDGMFRHETFTAWASMMKDNSSMGGDEAGAQYRQALTHRPHAEVDDVVFGISMPWYRDMVLGTSPDAAVWQEAQYQLLTALPENMTVPVLMIGGWYDVFFGPQLEDWNRLATQSASRFIIGPWSHIGSTGEALQVENAGGGLFQWHAMLDWLGHHLKGQPLMNPPGVASYVLGDNTWIERSAWPPITTMKNLYLGDIENSNSCEGGQLLTEFDGQESSISYQYDPDDPVPTRGGAGMLAFALPGFDGSAPGNVFQDGLCEREDVLTFISAPVVEAMHIAGKISVDIPVSSSAVDTAFTMKLMEVDETGRAVNIRDAITSLAYRNGAQYPQVYWPGEKVMISIKSWPIEWRVAPGKRLRLDISSSDFPKFHAHSNQPGNWAEVTDIQTATQTLFSGDGKAVLQLPVIAN